jgi:hypothetical protein
MVFPIPSILLPQVVLLTFMQVVETFNIWLLVVEVLVDIQMEAVAAEERL